MKLIYLQNTVKNRLPKLVWNYWKNSYDCQLFQGVKSSTCALLWNDNRKTHKTTSTSNDHYAKKYITGYCLDILKLTNV